MNKVDSWSSEFRKKRFYEKQNLEMVKQLYGKDNIIFQKQERIVVMLDLDGTTNNIDDEKAIIFINQLESIRKKFFADKGIICISTHEGNTSTMRKVLDIISRNLPNTIEIGKCFFFGGVYDFHKDEFEIKGFGFNSNKIETFDSYYNYSNDNKWIGIIDDGISEEVFKRYQYKQPMLLCRPYQAECEKANDNFMSKSSAIKGIDGVIECMNSYIKSIEKMTPQMILRKQQEMIYHLHGYELNEKTRNREYAFLIQYFTSVFADFANYKDTVTWLGLTAFKQDLTKDELKNIKELIRLFEKEYQSKDNLDKEKFKEFKKTFYENIAM